MMSAKDLTNIEDAYKMQLSKDGTLDYIDTEKMTRMIQDVYGTYIYVYIYAYICIYVHRSFLFNSCTVVFRLLLGFILLSNT
jgi:hypothetical protein